MVTETIGRRRLSRDGREFFAKTARDRFAGKVDVKSWLPGSFCRVVEVDLYLVQLPFVTSGDFGKSDIEGQDKRAVGSFD